jgi:hypothetical protein
VLRIIVSLRENCATHSFDFLITLPTHQKLFYTLALVQVVFVFAV